MVSPLKFKKKKQSQGSFPLLESQGLGLLHHLVVASVIHYAVVCWSSRRKVANATRLNKLIRKAGSVLGVELGKLLSIMDATKTK